MFFNQSVNSSAKILDCVAGGIVCAKFEPQSREGNVEKQFEIAPAGNLGFFVSFRALEDGKFGLVESCEHVNQILDDLSISPKGNLNNFSPHRVRAFKKRSKYDKKAMLLSLYYIVSRILLM